MKTKLFSLAALCLSLTACGTLKPGAPIDPKAIEKSAVVFRTAVGDSVILAKDRNAGSAAYFALGKTILDSFITGSDFSPATLRKALQAIPVKELQSAEARIAINTIAGLYEIYWGDYVRGQVAGNAIAVKLLTAARDGLVDGLGSP